MTDRSGVKTEIKCISGFEMPHFKNHVFREIQSNKQHQLKKQMTVNYFRPFEKENIALDYNDTQNQVLIVFNLGPLDE